MYNYGRRSECLVAVVRYFFFAFAAVFLGLTSILLRYIATFNLLLLHSHDAVFVEATALFISKDSVESHDSVDIALIAVAC